MRWGGEQTSRGTLSVLTETLSAEPSAAAGCARCCSTPLRRVVAIVVCTGGTGITGRDITPDVISELATREIPGFGELFRWLSYRDIGSSTVQSRAGAWLCQTTLVFALPGSTNACRLAMDEILTEQLDVRHRPCNFIQLMPRFTEV